MAAAAGEAADEDAPPQVVLVNGEGIPYPLPNYVCHEHFTMDDDSCRLSFAYRDLEAVPDEYASRYGTLTRRLDLSNNRLTSLAFLAGYSTLQELILDSNDLGDNVVLPGVMPTLETLSLNKNYIEEVEPVLAELKLKTPNLRFLSLLGNVACPNELVSKEEEDYQRYRYLVLYSLPGLKFLDSRPVSAAEVKEAQRVGEYMRVVRVRPEDLDNGTEEPVEDNDSGFNPLPQDERPADGHKGTLSTCKYVYFGRHSEGNRFIRNSDL